ncbi:hypothetical protein PSTG_04259 [Puccinia striiformis f. sp. tritici PST-78]|uniref:tripeptidyl-peptidase II n=1 Tax=Puccinia striiformis f. sp. tritici PST-78 TaxID=1165861 RepID=A0A0L0VTX7_9BASI|nr:hypothetical protein PSTG_04259 [Puccinia striiformis f. sp. tritici PST-78]
MKNLLVGLVASLSFASGTKLHWERASQVALEPSVLFETHRAPARFQKIDGPPRNDHRITLQIGLKNARFEDSIGDLLERISDPNHPNFRPHLNDEEFSELIKPDDETMEAVVGWLKVHGFPNGRIKWTAHKDWITLDGVPLKKVEHMLNTTYSVYQDQGGEYVIRTERYSLPKSLHRHIELIQFGSLHKQRSRVRQISQVSEISNKRLLDHIPDICLGPVLVTNGCLRQLYKTENYQVQVPDRNMIATTGYLGESANFDDAQLFLKTQRTDQLGKSFDVILVNGGSNPQELNQEQIDKQLGVEANLDTQTTLGMTLPTRNIFYSVGGSPPFIADLATPENSNEPFLEWLQFMFGKPQEEIPKVISSSYGDEEQSVPLSYARRVCNGFAALSSRGVSLLFSSGDYGVGESGTCFTNDERRKRVFLPDFPASCPYVTAVGGTENFYPEVAVSKSGLAGFASGGGFSNYFESPEWQRKTVERYLQEFLGPNEFKDLYNRTGRAYPDVAAQGSRYAIAWRQTFLSVDGTSASAPTFASVIALLNDYSISLGGPPLGFLNPWLYAFGFNGLNDIISGSADGCDTSGFGATGGWDPVTGLGTPDFKKLQDLVRPWSLAMAQRKKASRSKIEAPSVNATETHG